MIVYRIKHLCTGLYFKPSIGTANNLSKHGKLYTRKPSLSYTSTIKLITRPNYNKSINKIIGNCFGIDTTIYQSKTFRTELKDWIIEEVK